MIATLPEWMTEAQREAYERLRETWGRVSEPQRAVGLDCVMVECQYEGGGTMWIGIEADGYTHS